MEQGEDAKWVEDARGVEGQKEEGGTGGVRDGLGLEDENPPAEEALGTINICREKEREK